MAERLSDVEARIGSVSQLSAVITAMRGIAAVRSHEAAARLPGIRTYADTVGEAIAQALALLAERPPALAPAPATATRQLVIAVCAEQGFVGSFNARILDAAAAALARSPASDLIIVGSRGTASAAERGLEADLTMAMATHSDQLPGLANRLADRLFERLQRGPLSPITIVHAVPAAPGAAAGTVTEVALFPFDFGRFPPVSHARPPLIQLPAATLLERLADEYVFAQLCEALTLSYAAENEARMRAMVAARANVHAKLDDLRGHARRLRQEQITEEVVELAAGSER
ncbi:hypothetical protein B2G71_15790 [Novosphingobium sp. PC22D]|uniref:F0F1 ATP synthase subunit gamma n=1 Tax=Novosphingobium sp. PC22D TaxID=1962403 RepID=UPI000BF23190|nr:FoF1 ATP synthase subunit gamma [Novosphingobium sp. PC22D]PEQ11590.1 hypothetical protein B2G71_15790 [Novosphingobium sp. PC22D]